MLNIKAVRVRAGPGFPHYDPGPGRVGIEYSFLSPGRARAGTLMYVFKSGPGRAQKYGLMQASNVDQLHEIEIATFKLHEVISCLVEFAMKILFYFTK